MRNPFLPRKIDDYRNDLVSLQSAYREAIQLNKEFRVVKKIYVDLKKTERQLEKALEKNKGQNA